HRATRRRDAYPVPTQAFALCNVIHCGGARPCLARSLTDGKPLAVAPAGRTLFMRSPLLQSALHRGAACPATRVSCETSGPPPAPPGYIAAREGVHMHRWVRRFIREESGEDLIEYGLLAAFVAA